MCNLYQRHYKCNLFKLLIVDTMQITSPDCDSVAEAGVAPFEEVSLSRGLRKFPSSGSVVVTATTTTISTSTPSAPILNVVTASMMTATTTTTTTSTTIRTTACSGVSADDHKSSQVMTTNSTVRPECHCQQTTVTTIPTSKTTSSCCCEKENKEDPCTCRLPNPRKRKAVEEDERADNEQSEVLMKYRNTDSENYRRLLMLKRRLLANLAQRNNVPLFCLYGDLLLIPKYRWGNGMGFGSRQRGMDPDFSAMNPMDGSNSNLESSSRHHSRSSTPSLVQLQIDDEDPRQETHVNDIILLLNQLGVCVIDNFLADDMPDQILAEVEALHNSGEFQAGQVMSRNLQNQASRMVRGDETTWVTGSEPHCRNIGHLMSKVDRLVVQANRHQDAGELTKYNIRWRTRAMVACYPGRGTHYVKHVDNPDGDGRCITAIYYLNKDWRQEDGGVLRIMPEGTDKVANIDPIFNRMLFFWSDRRNPHEVLPAYCTRYAITLWYHDQREREEYLSRMPS